MSEPELINNKVSELELSHDATSTVTHGEGAHDEHSQGITVHLKPDVLGNIGPIHISNSLVTSVVGSIILVVLVLLLSRNLKLVPGKVQLLFEHIVEGGFNYCKSVLENDEVARKVFPLVASFFIFIANESSFYPSPIMPA